MKDKLGDFFDLERRHDNQSSLGGRLEFWLLAAVLEFQQRQFFLDLRVLCKLFCYVHNKGVFIFVFFDFKVLFETLKLLFEVHPDELFVVDFQLVD